MIGILLSMTVVFSVIAAAASFLALSCAGNLRIELSNIARQQAELTVAVGEGVLRGVQTEFTDRNYEYDYLSKAVSDIAYKVTGDPDYAPLNSADE